jgi:uncharacterized membrane protein
MKPRPEIKRQARDRFNAQYGISIGAMVLAALVTSAVSATFIGFLLLAPLFMMGYSWFTLCVYRGGKCDIGEMLGKFFKDYARNLGGMLWMFLFTILWTLLFIIPGIVKSLAYFMTPYILAECPNVKMEDALKLSMCMTKGHKGRIFVMCLSFIGWALLSAITFGIIYIVYAGPYMNTSVAGLYEELKKNALETGVVSAEELA